MKPTLFAFLALTVLSGCTRLSDRGFERARFSADVKTVAHLRLADYTSYNWDRVHIFAPYTPEQLIEEEVGRRVPFPGGSSESHCLLVFRLGRDIVAAFEIERQSGDLAGLYRKGGYARDEAVFTISMRPDGGRYLAPKTSRTRRQSQRRDLSRVMLSHAPRHSRRGSSLTFGTNEAVA